MKPIAKHCPIDPAHRLVTRWQRVSIMRRPVWNDRAGTWRKRPPTIVLRKLRYCPSCNVVVRLMRASSRLFAKRP